MATTRMPQDELERLRAREPPTLAALVDEHLPALHAGALAAGLSPADAEEAVQETFAAFLEGADRFEGRSAVRTYLFGILYHKVSRLRERSGRERPEEDIDALVASRFDGRGMWTRPAQGPEAQALDAELRRIVEGCAEGLSGRQRLAFYLKEVEGEDNDAICNVLGVSGTHLRVMLHRARLKLRECLERRWEEGL